MNGEGWRRSRLVDLLTSDTRLPTAMLPGSTKPQARRQGPHRMSPGPGRRGGRWDQSSGSAQRVAWVVAGNHLALPELHRHTRNSQSSHDGFETVPRAIRSDFDASAELGPIDRRRGGIIRAAVGLDKLIELLRASRSHYSPPNESAHADGGGASIAELDTRICAGRRTRHGGKATAFSPSIPECVFRTRQTPQRWRQVRPATVSLRGLYSQPIQPA